MLQYTTHDLMTQAVFNANILHQQRTELL